MKKTLLISAALNLLAAHLFAQGQITFSTGNANLIQFSTDGKTATAYAGGTGASAGSVGFFAAPNGTALSLSSGLPNFTSAWTPVTTVATVGTLGDGVAVAGDITLPSADGAAGANVELEVVAWSGTATTWASAVANDTTDMLGFSGETFDGSQEGGLGWSQATGSVPPPQVVATGSSAYNGIVLMSHAVATPEPSTVFLGGAGAVVLMLSRFLKSRKTKPAAR
jgi:hypothetical protein